MMLDDIGTLLQTAGLGTVGSTIFKGQRPPTPDQCLSLYQYAGNPPGLVQGARYEYPGLQVWARSSDPVAPLTMLDAVIDALHGVTNYQTTYARYLIFTAKQSPEAMGRDDLGRTEYVVNFRVTMTRL